MNSSSSSAKLQKNHISHNSLVRVRCPGTFGEFVQGKIDNFHFLVTSPINRYSTVTYSAAQIPKLQIEPSLFKVTRMCKALADALQIEFHGFLELHTNIPQGKGLASSSADIVAAGSALLHSASVPAADHAKLLEHACSQIEPTDGVMHSGIVCFAQHNCQLVDHLGAISYEILGCVLPGEINTCSYDSSRIEYSDAQKKSFIEAVEYARLGIKTGDLYLLGKAATISAVINQVKLPKPNFELIMHLAKSDGAAGVVVAHSGTAIGILLAQDISTKQRTHIQLRLEDIYGCEAESFLSDSLGPIATRFFSPQ